jgi:hypothetical protein
MRRNRHNNHRKVRINVIRNRDYSGPLHVSRNASLLHGIVSVQDYEDFCYTIDALLAILHEIQTQATACFSRVVLLVMVGSILEFLIFIALIPFKTYQPVLFHYYDSMYTWFVFQ